MDYKVSVPLTGHYENREDNLNELKRLGASRVFLCEGRGFLYPDKIPGKVENLKKSVEYYRSHGYEVGVWISTIGHGGELSGASEEGEPLRFDNVLGFHGDVSSDSFCPLDKAFREAVCSYVKSLATSYPDMIMLDDDYRLSFRRNAAGCFCEHHKKEFERLTGERLDGEEAFKKIFAGGPNKYRDAFLQCEGDSLRLFARELREAVDSVDSSIRLGHCAVMSTYDLDGVDSFELARIFAGKTKPFLRTIGAPYWAAGKGFLETLPYVIECERMQEYWAREYPDIELFSEGDVYPRPRYNVPSSYLEIFDTALRASGGFDGILKYALDYSSGPLYEKGYTNRAYANIGAYKELDRFFIGAQPSGLRLTTPINTIKDSVFPDEVKSEKYYAADTFFRPEQRFLCDNSVPTSYTGDFPVVLFGESARHADLSLLKNGAFLDVPAALILKERGVDAGLVSCEITDAPHSERFGDTTVLLDGRGEYYSITISPNAQALSFFDDKTASYYFENEDNNRFVVYAFNASDSRWDSRLFRNYCRQKQIFGAVKLLCGKELDAVCEGNPDLYILTARRSDGLAVGLWNAFADSVLEPVIKLSQEYSSAEFLNCSGELRNNELRLNTPIHAFEFAAVLLKS